MTRTCCLLYLYTHSDCRMTRTSCLLYLYTHSDCRMTRTSCLLYLYTHSDCRMTRTCCLLYLYTHSDCRMTIVQNRTGDGGAIYIPIVTVYRHNMIAVTNIPRADKWRVYSDAHISLWLLELALPQEYNMQQLSQYDTHLNH